MDINLTDNEAAAVSTEPRVSIGSIESKISGVEYIHPSSLPWMTLAIVKMANGFAIVGKSTPVSAANFNKSLGEKFALEDAIRQAWAFEGYLLREKLSKEAA